MKRDERAAHAESADALEQRLRAEAQTIRDNAPEDLAPEFLAALARERRAPASHERGRSISRIATLAAAAAVVIAVGLGLRAAWPGDGPAEPRGDTSTGGGAGIALVEPRGSMLPADFLAQPLALARDAYPARLGAKVEAPLRAELEGLAADSRGLARTFLGGVPSPLRRALGFP